MKVTYDSTEGEQSVTVTHDGTDYTASRTVGSSEGYTLDHEPVTEVPVAVRREVANMNPEGVNSPEEETEKNAADGGSA